MEALFRYSQVRSVHTRVNIDPTILFLADLIDRLQLTGPFRAKYKSLYKFCQVLIRQYIDKNSSS